MERLDFDNRKAFVRQVECDYYTDAIRYDRVTILDTFETTADRRFRRRRASSPAQLPPVTATSPAVSPALWAHGEVHVVSRVVGFKKIKFYTNENVGSGELDLPEQEMHTTGCWLTIPRGVMTALPYGGDDRRDGVVGLAFAMRQIAQLLLMCDRHDIGVSIGNGNESKVDRAREPTATRRGSCLGMQSARRRDFDEPRDLRLRQLPGRHRPVRSRSSRCERRCSPRRAA